VLGTEEQQSDIVRKKVRLPFPKSLFVKYEILELLVYKKILE